VKLSEGRLGARRVGNGGEEECGEEGQASHPFIGPEGGAGRPDGERDRPAVECDINGLHTFGFWEGKGGGKWGVKRGGATPFLGEEGTPGRCARARGGAGGCAVGFSRWKKVGRGPHGSERRGWRRLGRPEAKAWWGGRPVAGPGKREAAQERRGVGRWQITRSGGKRKGGRAETISQAEIQ
jgi:hypothetical protein